MLHLYSFERRKIYAHILHLNLFEIIKKAIATYEISPKVIDIQEGYNKNFDEDHSTKET